MGLSATSELALDLGPPASCPAASRAVAGFLRQAAASGDGRAARLEDYVRGLEEERRKIEGFRRELPLCMLVLNDVIGGLKEELRRAEARCRPVLEEFMPAARKSSDEEHGGVNQESNDRDKVNWMSSAQLWSDNSSTNTSSTASITVATGNNAGSSASSRKNTDERAEDDRRTQEDENPFADSRCRNGGGAFMAFKGPPGYQGSRPRKEKVGAEVVPLPDLSLLSPATTKASRAFALPMADDRWSGWSSSRDAGAGAGAGRGEVSLQTPPSGTQQPPRKARRCWSPELHRRFVDALQQLGGAQVATPKQIRDLMKVDGLTNDEVKSHLQKYRLHTRKVPGAPNPANQQQVVMFGGLWLSHQEGYHPAAKEGAGGPQSGSPQGPLHLATAAQMRMSMMTGDSCEEEEEDGKSESYTWKGHNPQSGEETD